ncbi:MFS transporter, partial [Chloroflexota bacterium]
VAFFILVIMYGTYYSFGVFFKPILTNFDWTRTTTSGAFSTFLILHGIFYIFVGRICDRFGPRVVVSACGFVLGIGYVLMSQISSLWQLYLFYGVFVAIGMTGSAPIMVATIARWFVRRRGLVTGLVVAGISVGTVVMPPIATRLIAAYDWRISYLIIGIVALCIIVPLAQFLRANPSEKGLSPYGFKEAESERLAWQSSGYSLMAAIRTRQFLLLAVANICFAFFQQTIMVHIIPHATDVGITEINAANIIAIIGGGGILGRIALGIIADRVGAKRSMVICFAVIALAFPWLTVSSELWMLYSFAAIFGIAYGGLITLLSVITAELFGLAALASIMGFSIFAATLGGAAGPVLAGSIFDASGSYNLAFLICMAMAVIAVIASTLIRPIEKMKS